MDYSTISSNLLQSFHAPIISSQTATCHFKNHIEIKSKWFPFQESSTSPHSHISQTTTSTTTSTTTTTTTMPPSTTPFHSSLSFSPHNSSSSSSQQQQQINPKSLLHKHPLWSPTHKNISIQFKEKILCLEILNIDSGKALSQNPSLQTASLTSIHTIITFLQSKGIHQKDLGRIIGMCPNILTSDIKSELNPVFNFLSRDLKVPEHDFRRVVNKNPRLLISSVEDQLKPALFYLFRLGFKDLNALAYQDSILLVSSVENTLIPKLDFLKSLGFSKSDVIDMVLRCPGLFTFSVENNFKPKFEYFVEEMEGDLMDLKEFPQYFAFSLEKRIKPRYIEVKESGVNVSLALMLKSTDEEFKELIRKKGV